MSERRLRTKVSRTRSLIEAYASTLQPESDPPDEGGKAVTASEDSAAGVVDALDFLDSCVLLFVEADSASGNPNSVEGTKVGGTGEGSVVVAEVSPAAGTEPLRGVPKHPAPPDALGAWRVPRGLIYWLSVGVAGTTTWRLTSSLYGVAVAALLASAIVIVLELILRTIDPRVARRLGLARGKTSATLYGAAAVLGLVTGVAVVYSV